MNQKMSFSVISPNFLCSLFRPKNHFLTTCPKMRNTKNRGFSKPTNQNQLTVTKRPFLDQKSQNPEIPVIIFVFLFFSFNFKNTKPAETPIFMLF